MTYRPNSSFCAVVPEVQWYFLGHTKAQTKRPITLETSPVSLRHYLVWHSPQRNGDKQKRQDTIACTHRPTGSNESMIGCRRLRKLK